MSLSIIGRHPKKNPPMCDRCAVRAARWLLTEAEDDLFEGTIVGTRTTLLANVCDECLSEKERDAL